MTSHPRVRASSKLDRRAIRAVFAQAGRVHVPGFFAADTAQAIYSALAEQTPWQLSLNSADRHLDVPTDYIERLSEQERARLTESIHRGARAGFQYVFDNFPIHDLYVADRHREHYLMRVYEFLNSPEFLSFAREVTGLQNIVFVDAQATRYRPGHFLTQHDDAVEGKDRLAAYVLGFSPKWSADWGGILQFIDGDGHVTEGYTPAFNALNLIRVPQAHSVSYVTPWAAGGRYSITGWLRGSLEAPSPPGRRRES